MAKIYQRLAEAQRGTTITANDDVYVAQGGTVVRIPATVVAQQLGSGEINLPDAILQKVLKLEAVNEELSDDTALHTLLIGPYAKRITVPLTADYGIGKVLRVNAQTGLVEAVEKSGWGISRLTAEGLAAMGVSGGDTAFISMLNASGQSVMESGIVVFAIETETRNDEGVVIRRTLTSKYNAQNADVTIDGHLQTDYDLTSDQNLLISHPLTTEAVEFLRSALSGKNNTLKQEVVKVQKQMGDPQNLNTDNKATLVDAINEVYAYAYTDKSMVYGVRHMYEQASCGLIRIGNEDLHATLPVQHLIRRCVLKDDGEVAYYLDAHDSTKKEDGTPALLDGTDGQVMVEIPQHYRRFTDHEDLKAYDCEISLLPFEGAHMVKKCYISAYQATIHRPDNKLSSVASMAPEYRGGDNSATYDGTYRTMLGRPASGSVSLTSARTSAHNRGDGWEQMVYDVYVALYWLYVVEYANLNSQLAFNGDHTDRGYRQGGLGNGVTNVNGTQWSEKFGFYGFVPCGVTNELGNQTGVIDYEVPDAEGVWCTVSVPSYRGVENPFGHIWHWCDGFLAVGNGEKQEYFICHDRTRFVSAKNDAYESIGMSAGANGYMKTMLRTELGDILAAVVNSGATSGNYFADYHYEAFANGTTYGLRLGGSAFNGANAGFVCGYSNCGPSHTDASIGSRLCYINGTSALDF